MPLAFFSNSKIAEGLGVSHEERQLMTFLAEQQKAVDVPPITSAPQPSCSHQSMPDL